MRETASLACIRKNRDNEEECETCLEVKPSFEACCGGSILRAMLVKEVGS